MIMRIVLTETPFFQMLNLNENQLTSHSVDSIVNVMHTCPIEILLMHENSFDDNGIATLLTHLMRINMTAPENFHLRRLDIGKPLELKHITLSYFKTLCALA